MSETATAALSAVTATDLGLTFSAAVRVVASEFPNWDETFLRAMAGYDVNGSARILNPGPFESEPIFVPFFAAVVGEGFHDGETDGDEPYVDVDASAALLFPMLADHVGDRLVLTTDNSGFWGHYFESEGPIRCDQCEAAMINGVFCHETGCVNQGKTWESERGEWVRYVDCFECGCEVEEGESCDCSESFEESEEFEEEEEETDHAHADGETGYWEACAAAGSVVLA